MKRFLFVLVSLALCMPLRAVDQICYVYFTDTNGNGVWNPGEPMAGAYDQIIFRCVTGYSPRQLNGQNAIPTTGQFKASHYPMGASTELARYTRGFTGATTDFSAATSVYTPGSYSQTAYDVWYDQAFSMQILNNTNVTGVPKTVFHRVKSVLKPGTVASKRTIYLDVMLPMTGRLDRYNYTVEIHSTQKIDTVKDYVIRIGESAAMDAYRLTPAGNPPALISHLYTVGMPTPAQLGGTGTAYPYYVWKRVAPGEMTLWHSGWADNNVPVSLYDPETVPVQGQTDAPDSVDQNPPIAGDPPTNPLNPQANAGDGTSKPTGGNGLTPTGGDSGSGGDPSQITNIENNGGTVNVTNEAPTAESIRAGVADGVMDAANGTSGTPLNGSGVDNPDFGEHANSPDPDTDDAMDAFNAAKSARNNMEGSAESVAQGWTNYLFPSGLGSRYSYAVSWPIVGSFTVDLSPYATHIQTLRAICLAALAMVCVFHNVGIVRSLYS